MNINELLAAYNRIVIPRIQRDYAQGRQDSRTKEIRSNLLNDLFSMKNVSFNMIFGESDDGRNFIPIDGQQRLTLLFLLALYGHKKVDKADMGLDKLFYSTRESSTEFWNYIIRLDWKSLSDTETVTDWCKNQNGFQWYWSMDPTVQSMLCVLDDIHKMYIESPLHYPDVGAIEFDIHDMTQTGLNETLYIKMNSRGKHLNAFEQIKSNLDALLSEGSDDYDTTVYNNYPWDIDGHDWSFAKKWAYCMDRDWSNWFWDPESASLDGTLLKLILAYTYVFLSRRVESKDKADSLVEKCKAEILPMLKLTSSEILSRNLNITPSISHITGAFSVFNDQHRLVDNTILRRNYFEGLARLLCNLVHANRNFASSWGDIIDLRNPELKFENKQLAILASLIFYNGDCYLGKDFGNWMRFCWNMVENTVEDNDSFTAFSRNCKDYYSQGSSHIYIWLNSQYAQIPVLKSENGKNQLDEEILKASLLACTYMEYKSSMAENIIEAESHKLLKGRLRPLLLDEQGSLSHIGFLKRYSNFKSMFNSNGDVIDPLSFIRDYIMCADTRSAMSYNYDSEWSILLTSPTAIRNKFKDKVYDSVWPYLFASPLGCKTILQRDSNQVAELHIREQLLTPGFIEAVLSNNSWKSNKPRIRWYYGTYFLYPSDKRGDWYYIMLDWYGNSNEEWNRKAVHLLNSLIEKGIVRMNTDKSVPLINGDNNSYKFWIGKDLFFFYKNQEYKLCKDYKLSKVSEDICDSISVIGVNTDNDFVSILDMLYVPALS